MNRKLRRYFLILIFLCTGAFLALDGSRIIQGIPIPVIPGDPSRLLKRAVSLLALLLVWTAGPDAWERTDSRRMRALFLLIFAGDLLLLFNLNRAGIALFVLVQILMILRNSRGLADYWISGSLRQDRLWLTASGAAAAGLWGLLAFGLFGPLTRGRELFVFIQIYIPCITLSLWVSWLTLKIGHFPRTGALLIGAGMTCFFLCDITVGLRMSLTGESARSAATALTWVFYAPALTLLALSSYDPKRLVFR